MEQKRKIRIRDLLTDYDKERYRTLTRDLMFCSSDSERELVNNKIASLLLSVVERQLPKADEQETTLEDTIL